MSARALFRLLAIYGVVLLLVGLAVDRRFALTPIAPFVVATRYDKGQRVARAVDGPGIEEVAVAEGPLSSHPLLFALGLVPGRDGVRAELDGKVAFATVDDLYASGAYDHAWVWTEQSFGIGTHRETVLAILAAQMNVPAREVRERAVFRRIRFEHRNVPPPITPAALSRDLVRARVAEAATHLARDVGPDGRFRYLIDAPTNKTLRSGYNWPRHSGSTFFLAQAAALLDDPFVRYAALRAAARLRDDTMRDCGAFRCIASAEQPIADLGSSALALVAFTEIVRTGADGAYRPALVELAAFLRSQQRPDGEMMHFYDRNLRSPIDRPALYYTGEATLALARAFALTGDPRDLAASQGALRYLVGSGWSFFGSRYYFGEEHWTCQAIAELWAHAPDPDALAFCGRWHVCQRRLQQGPDDAPFDADGAFNFGPIASPRVTPASSRGEAAAALLDVLVRERAAGHAANDLNAVDDELRRALAFVLRQQLSPGPAHLFADPVAVRGAVPGSPVDTLLRIDYAQHAGSMMIRWLEIEDRRN